MKNKNLTIDIARGLAIILVVYGHVIEHSVALWNPSDFFQNPVFKIIYTFHMPLFVFISGYLMAYSLNRNSVKDVFKSRCKSLLVPFITLGILGTIVTYVLNFIFWHHTSRVDLGVDLANQLLVKPSIWFLLTLFVVSGLLCLSVKCEKLWGKISFVLIYLMVMFVPLNNFSVLYYIKWFYLFYLAGYFFNKSNFKIPPQASKTMILLAALIIFAWLVSFWNRNDYIYINKMEIVPNHFFEGVLRLVYRYILGFLGIMIAFFAAAYLSKTKAGTWLGDIGVYSLDIYIIQMFILEGIYPRWVYKAHIYLDFNSPFILYIIAPLLTMFFISICMLISMLIIRKNHLLNRLLLGGRSA